MNAKELILQEIEETPESLLVEVLDFLRFLKAKQTQEECENQEDLEDALAALAEAKQEGTVSWQSLKAEVGL